MSNAEKQPEAGKTSFRWGRLVLVISLALNLMVLGIVGGAVLSRGGPSGPPRIDVLSFGPYTAALDQDGRRVLRREIFAEGKGVGNVRKLLRQDFEAVLAALRATPFDAEATGVLMNVPTDRIAGHADYVRQHVLELIMQMDDAERAAYADRLEEKLRKGPPRPDKPPRPPQDRAAD
ncbi:hypothetical protein ATO10_11452 [Actibacterium atlanticum]|uniref:Uncharacterized protein n=1 Tax=Actibacterium atlanticum TaxID=1461693 RepID=A0A058ZJX8_9RHOB|nr:periplasmic heavy metal sensor [Actibacterium atlanticum]KCV81525.1 hypothetical protein ATO10_11452 [Actibacterium atlanticum]